MKSDMKELERNSQYIDNVPAEHTNAARKWIDDGVFKRTDGPLFAENPTLTGVDCASRYAPYSYGIPPGHYPFSGWDYLQVKKFKSSSCLVTMYGDYIECILRKFMKALSKEQVSFQIVLCDCTKIKEHLEEGTVYDRILTSNLMDYLFLPKVLKLCSQMLNHENNKSTIITETMVWSRDVMPDADIGWPINMQQLPKLLKIACEDTKRALIMDGDCIKVREYMDNSCEFLNYLRALFYAYRLKKVEECESSNRKPTIPVIKELGNEFKLRLRDGIRNENRIVFFKPAVNRRRVTYVSGMERYLEWVPLHQS